MAFSLAQSNHDTNNRDDRKSVEKKAGGRKEELEDEDDPRIPNPKCMLVAFQACGKIAVAHMLSQDLRKRLMLVTKHFQQVLIVSFWRITLLSLSVALSIKHTTDLCL
jgi:hypothetical protein